MKGRFLATAIALTLNSPKRQLLAKTVYLETVQASKELSTLLGMGEIDMYSECHHMGYTRKLYTLLISPKSQQK